LKNKKIVYPIIIGLVAILAIAVSSLYLKPAEKDALSKPETSKNQSKTTLTSSANSKTPVVKTYKQEVIATVGAGKGKEEVGISSSGFETLAAGPTSISVDKHEIIYISDVLNYQIKKYDKNGKFIKNISSPIYPQQTTGRADKDNDQPVKSN
jgi:hypothetical protein